LIARLLYRDEGRRDEAFERHGNLRLAGCLIRTPITLRHFSKPRREKQFELKKIFYYAVPPYLITFCLLNRAEKTSAKDLTNFIGGGFQLEAHLENRFRGYSPTPYTFNATIHSCSKHHTHHSATFLLDNWPAARSCCRERRKKEVRKGIIGSRLPEQGFFVCLLLKFNRPVAHLCLTTCKVSVSNYFPFVPFPPRITNPRGPSKIIGFLVPDKMCPYPRAPPCWIRRHRKGFQPTRRN